MDRSTNDYVKIYKTQLEQGDIQIAYTRLLKYVMALKSYFESNLPPEYSVGNVSPGYMDYTYFPFFTADLRSKKLRFGIVLNHRQMRFELWLMGQNAKVQQEYWERLKDSEWNANREEMPRYSVLEAVLIESPDFDDTAALTAAIEKAALNAVNRIIPLC